MHNLSNDIMLVCAIIHATTELILCFWTGFAFMLTKMIPKVFDILINTPVVEFLSNLMVFMNLNFFSSNMLIMNLKIHRKYHVPYWRKNTSTLTFTVTQLLPSSHMWLQLTAACAAATPLNTVSTDGQNQVRITIMTWTWYFTGVSTLPGED